MTTAMEVQLLKALQDSNYFRDEHPDYQVKLSKKIFIRLHDHPWYLHDLQRIMDIADDVQRQMVYRHFTDEIIHLIMAEMMEMPYDHNYYQSNAVPLYDDNMEPASKMPIDNYYQSNAVPLYVDNMEPASKMPIDNYYQSNAVPLYDDKMEPASKMPNDNYYQSNAVPLYDDKMEPASQMPNDNYYQSNAVPLYDDNMEPPSKKPRPSTSSEIMPQSLHPIDTAQQKCTIFRPWCLHRINFPEVACININTPRSWRDYDSKRAILSSCRKNLFA